MVVKRRLRHRGDSSVTKSDSLGIRNNGQPLPSSPLRRMHDDEVSGMEAMLRRAKQHKTTTAKTPMSSSVSKMNWTRNDELVILASIVDYEKDTKLSYQSDWDAFYGYIIGSIEANFSKKQLKDKIRNLVKRFTDNQPNRKRLSFTSTEDDEIFKLSMLIWGTNETECVSNEHVDQDKVLDFGKDVPCAEREHEPLDDENMDQEKKDATDGEPERGDEMVDQEKDLNVPSEEHERVDETMDQDKIEDVPSAEHETVNENVDQEKDHVRETEHEPVSNISMEIGKGEKEKSEEDGVLQEALEALTLFRSLGKHQQNMMLQNLKNLGEQKRRELSDEWKSLFYEEMKLKIRILSFSAKLANAGVSE